MEVHRNLYAKCTCRTRWALSVHRPRHANLVGFCNFIYYTCVGLSSSSSKLLDYLRIPIYWDLTTFSILLKRLYTSAVRTFLCLGCRLQPLTSNFCRKLRPLLLLSIENSLHLLLLECDISQGLVTRSKLPLGAVEAIRSGERKRIFLFRTSAHLFHTILPSALLI